MSTRFNSTILVVTLMLTAGCTGLSNQEDSNNDIAIDCEIYPTHIKCLKTIILEDDCSSKEVFTGNNCRIMLRPENLNYGEKSIILSVGMEMQALTPSFIGDGPELWQVNPPLPLGFNLNENSGVITGNPMFSKDISRYTIIASNNAGLSTTTLDIEILPNSPKSIEYSALKYICTIGKICTLDAPKLQGGTPENWNIFPSLPSGLILNSNGSINGITEFEFDLDYIITISNKGGESFTSIRLTSQPEVPSYLEFPAENYSLKKNEYVLISPSINGGEVDNWTIEPTLPPGLRFINSDGSVEGKPIYIQDFKKYVINASNSKGSVSTDIWIEILDLPVKNIAYQFVNLQLSIDESIQIFAPSWQGGTPTMWQINPSLPTGLIFNYTNGEISGNALIEQEWIKYEVWANNSGGTNSTEINIRISNQIPNNISWIDGDYVFASNTSILIKPHNNGPTIDTWEVFPKLPNGIMMMPNGSIEGIPNSRSDWQEYTVWSNNSGGSFTSQLWLAIHDLSADQFDLLNGMGQTDWEGWPSPILPIGQWSFPIGFTEGGYTNDIPVISGSHVGRGKMIGYGHEGWVTGGGSQETIFSLRAVNWVCGENADVGIAYGTGFESFQDELENDGHNVVLDVTPEDLSQIDCLLDEFWNGHSHSDNDNITKFLLEGGGLIMGGHAWYWSYSNTDLAHNYPGNKIAQITGLFISNAWGYNSVDLSKTPHEFSRPYAAIEAIMNNRLNSVNVSDNEAIIIDNTLSICTGVVSLDFDNFWRQLRKTVNSTGWTTIEYGTLWENIGYNMGEDPIADVLLRVEDALTQNLPARELPIHPSHVEFPGIIPENITRISKIINIDGNQSGLPTNFGYSGARSPIRMSTGLYAGPGEVISISLNESYVNQGVSILIGAHSDNLWEKSQLHRFPNIIRYWYIDNTTLEVGNSFGGLIYISLDAGSELGKFDIMISNAIKAPYFNNEITNMTNWIQEIRDAPAPWAEIGSDLFIMTVPSEEIRNLDNPDELMEWWDEALAMEHELYGFTPWPRIERAVFDAQISVGWMHSGYPFMAHDLSVPDVLDLSYIGENGDWGMFHELGHNHQWMPSTLPGNTETTCNFASVYLMEELVGISGHSATDSDQRHLRMSEYFNDGSNINNWSVWVALDTHLIIKEKWGWAPFTDTLSIYYELPPAEVPSGDIEKFNSWVMHISNSTEYNLAPYFEAWGFPLNQETFDTLNQYPIWVDDPLRGEYYVYSTLIRNIYIDDIGETSANLNWETYDNGTNTSLTLHYGENDGGEQPTGWSNNVTLATPNIGYESYQLSELDSGTTYHARIEATNGGNSVWFGPISWTTGT